MGATEYIGSGFPGPDAIRIGRGPADGWVGAALAGRCAARQPGASGVQPCRARGRCAGRGARAMRSPPRRRTGLRRRRALAEAATAELPW